MDERREHAPRVDAEDAEDRTGAATDGDPRADAPRDGMPGKAATASVGGVAGAVTAGTVGTILAGPIGTIVGGIAGAVGGAWLGLAEGSPAAPSEEHEVDYRRHFEQHPDRRADVPFDRVRPAYQLGAIAARHPDYAGRPFTEIERDLQSGWTDAVAAAHGDWQRARPFVRAAYEGDFAHRRGATFADANLGGSESHQRASFSDPIPTYVDPAPTSTGQDSAGSRDTATHDEDPWIRDLVDQGGFGHHGDPSLHRDSDRPPD